MRLRTGIPLLITFAFAGLAGCGLADAEPRTLSITVEATPATVSLGSAITVSTRATGQSLFQTVIEYGNGFADTVGTVGFEQNLSLTYRYPSAGTQTIRATAFDALLGEEFAETVVNVQDNTTSN